jgi:hypothetical protein
MSSRGAYNLGATKGIGSSTRMFYNYKQTSPTPWNGINQFITINPPTPVPIPLPKPGKMKTVFLLELTAGDILPIDNSFKNTLNYYWNTYPQEFTRCPIVDTQGSLEINLSLLNEYYNLGYRYFVGFTNSTIMSGVLDWFNFHSDATGMTIFGISTTLNIPKNIYRLLPNNTYRIKYIPNLNTAPTVYYIYQEVTLSGVDIKNLLISEDLNDLRIFPANQSNMTLENIEEFLNGSSVDDILITLLSFSRNDYINLYSEGLVFDGQQYDVTANQLPNIPSGTASNVLSGKLNMVTFNGINTSILWRNGYNSLGPSNYNISALNILNMLNQFSNDLVIDNVNSHYGPLIFNPVTKDIEYQSVLLQKYNGTDFINTTLNVNDPYLGNYTATFVTNTPVSTAIIPISPNKPFNGKAIALLNLGYISNLDKVVYQSLYYFWYKDTSLPKFPITDITGKTSSEVAELLTNYYNQGYRLFLGPNFGDTIGTIQVKSWFSSHPDTTCICLFAGIPDPSIPKNIYRLSPLSTLILELMVKKIYASDKVYFMYDTGSPIGETTNLALANFCAIAGKTYKSFSIATYGSNLSVTNMLDFFGIDPINNTVTENDINIILSNSYLQNYLNLYSDVSMNLIVCPQYIASGQVDPTIPNEGTVLNENLYSIDITYPSTSYLWNENRLFLTNEYLSSTDSLQLINALKMMRYILAGKDIKLLGSHLGTLEFTSTNTIKYPSVLTQQYQSTPNKFVNFEINFTDPLLGTFTAEFV